MFEKLVTKVLVCSFLFMGLCVSVSYGTENAPESKKVVKEAAKVVPAGLPEISDQIEIKIGNEIITTKDIETPLEQLREHLKSQLRGAELESKMQLAKKQHIQRLIEGKLLMLEALAQEIEIQDTAIKEQAEKEIEKLKSQFPSQDAFKKQLLLEHLNEYELLKEREKIVREGLLRQRLLQMKLQEFKTGAEVSEERLKEYYEKNSEKFSNPGRALIKQIFIKRPDVSLSSSEFKRLDKQAETKAKQALKEIKQNKAFGVVAKRYSEHRLSAEKGGEIGWIAEGDLGLPEFDRAVFKTLKVGQVSKVLDTARGYFIVNVLDRELGGLLPLSEVKGRIRKALMAEGSEKRYKVWVETLKAKYKVVYSKKQ